MRHKKLIEEFPYILNKAYPECGEGWHNIIRELCKKIRDHDRSCFAIQVKEKFGGLRFYTNHEDDVIASIINEAEEMSYKTCELCGSTDSIIITKGWAMVRCKKCIEEMDKNEQNKINNN